METATDFDEIRFSTPLYTVAEAARALSVPPSTLATWAFGYERRSSTGRLTRSGPVLTAFKSDSGPSIPFIGLAEGMVLAAIRREGVPLQRIRPALEILKSEIGIEHALASKCLYTDGAELLFDLVGELPDEEAHLVLELIVVRSGQRVFTEVIRGYLKRISYAKDGYAKVIRLPGYSTAGVVADPKRSFGQPIFTHGGVRVADVLDRFWTGDDIETLVMEFGVPEPEVEDVIRVASRPAA